MHESLSKSRQFICPWLRFRLSTPSEREALDPRRFALSFALSVTLLALTTGLTILSALVVLGFIPSPRTSYAVGTVLTVTIAFSMSFMLSYSIAKQVKCLSVSHERYERLSHTDGLTGLRNRAGLNAGAVRLGKNYCLAFLDIDYFKSVNDTYGHAAGDLVILSVAQRILEAFPASALISRLGGEEFVIAVSDMSATEFSACCEDCRRVIQQSPFVADDVSVTVTVSIGVSKAAEDEAFSSVMHRADGALYRAKAAGRNRIVMALEEQAALTA